MTLFIRKLNKRSNIDAIVSNEDVEDLEADVVTSEFRTQGNTLSVWEVNNKDNIVSGVLAIVLSSSRIETMDFILLESDQLESHGLKIASSTPGKNPFIYAKDMHYDISELCLRSLSFLSRLYKDVCKDIDCVIRLSKFELKEMIKNANKDGLIDASFINDTLRKDWEQLGIS